VALPVRLDHLVIHVSDWERSNPFYRDVLGAELIEREGGGPQHYRSDGNLLELISYG
jgi:catechol 2,3-dioxygenase-like lactoylglutathione lyase family enzyme